MLDKSQDIVNRRPVWEALSNLFLDTDTTLFTDHIVNKLVESPYSFDEIKKIYLQEVYPACHFNLFSIAGEWAGFDEKWLEDRILKNPSFYSRISSFLFGTIEMVVSLQWKAIKNKFEQKRASRRERK